jgi:hypothetical protein
MIVDGLWGSVEKCWESPKKGSLALEKARLVNHYTFVLN